VTAGIFRHDNPQFTEHSSPGYTANWRQMKTLSTEAPVAHKEDDDLVVVPLPGEESKAEHDRIRKSNDLDQKLEREGRKSRHNQGYDEVADGKTADPQPERVVDE
jgi:hypothetical protein